MSDLNELLQDINATIASTLPYPKAVYYAQAHLQTKNDQTFPIVNKGNRKGIQISLNSKVALQCYHRLLESKTQSDVLLGYGKKTYSKRIYTLRNVWLGYLGMLPKKPFETNDNVKTEVYKAFPKILTNKEIVFPQAESVDKLEVLSEEFEGINLGNLSLDVVAFYIEYEIHQKIDC